MLDTRVPIWRILFFQTHQHIIHLNRPRRRRSRSAVKNFPDENLRAQRSRTSEAGVSPSAPRASGTLGIVVATVLATAQTKMDQQQTLGWLRSTSLIVTFVVVTRPRASRQTLATALSRNPQPTKDTCLRGPGDGHRSQVDHTDRAVKGGEDQVIEGGSP